MWGPLGTFSPNCLESPTTGPMSWRAVYPHVWFFTDQTWSRVSLGGLAPPFHSNNKSIPYHLGPSGHFSSGCFRVYLTAVLGLQSLPGSFLPFIFLLIFSTIIYHLSQLQQFLKKTDLVQTPLFVTYVRYLEPTE